MESFKKGLLIYSGILILLGTFLLGWYIGRSDTQIPSPGTAQINPDYTKNVSGIGSLAPNWFSSDVEFDIFWQAWNTVQTSYVDRPIGESQLLYGAMHGLAGSLGDPYSRFLEPRENESFQDELNGKFEGIGAEIGIRDNRLTIIAPLPDTPAERAGLKAGDKVYFIDDFDSTDIALDEAVFRIRGEKGSTVTLTIFREGDEDFRDISIKRDTIRIIPVEYEMMRSPNGENIAYIKVNNFNADTDTRFRRAVNELLAQGPDGFLIDMRNNPGGFLDKAIELSDYWIPGGHIVVLEKFSEENIQSHLATGTTELDDFPTVVLINRGSASGSEIFAGALRDHDRATLIGETTFGKGSVQDVKAFKDGSALKLTIAKWLTPDGHEIDGVGIDPDIEIELTEDDFNNDLDPQLDRALDFFDEGR